MMLSPTYALETFLSLLPISSYVFSIKNRVSSLQRKQQDPAKYLKICIYVQFLKTTKIFCILFFSMALFTDEIFKEDLDFSCSVAKAPCEEICKNAKEERNLTNMYSYGFQKQGYNVIGKSEVFI